MRKKKKEVEEMSSIRSQKGFTLVELAIVLVIIGIILGAVIKGQDLIENARHKKFIAKVKEWENATWTFFDRKGRFPGDANGDGIIGDGNVRNDLIGAKFIYPPYEGTNNSISLGSQTFYVFLGNDGGKKNILAVCGDQNCGALNDDSKAEYLGALDAALDGVASGTHGQVVAYHGTNVQFTSATWVVSGSVGSLGDWTSQVKALLYYFDAKR